jgi:hypothetical protein
MPTLPDLTALLEAIEQAAEIGDPVGRYQALHMIATLAKVNYATLTHLSALYQQYDG